MKVTCEKCGKEQDVIGYVASRFMCADCWLQIKRETQEDDVPGQLKLFTGDEDDPGDSLED